MDRSVPKWVIIILLIIGVMLFLSDSYFQFENKKNYSKFKETKATYFDKLFSNIDDGYKLIYEYKVDGEIYMYITDYSTIITPMKGSKIKIKYNPDSPSEAYSPFNGDSTFRILGIMFIFIPLIILFSKLCWLRDILFIAFSSSFFLVFIPSGLNSGWGIVAIMIFGLFGFGGFFDLIGYLKNNKFNPIKDIKKEIKITKKIKLQKKENKLNASLEEKLRRKKKIKRIIVGLVEFIIPIPLLIIIDTNIGFPNQIMYYIFSFVSIISCFVGFITLFLAIFLSDKKEYIINTNDGEIIRYSPKMTLREKIKVFRIKETILRVLFLFIFFVIIVFIVEDPLEIYQNFELVGRAQLFTILILILLIDGLNLIINKVKINLKNIIKYIILFIIFYVITIPSDANKTIVSISNFKENMTNKNFIVSKESKINFLDNYNSDIYLAQKDNIKVYYIVGKDRKIIRNIEDSTENSKYIDCIEKDFYSISGSERETRCKNPTYIRILYTIKNTIMIAESNNIHDVEKLKSILREFGYSNIN